MNDVPQPDELRRIRAKWKSRPQDQTETVVGVAASFTTEPLEPYLGTALLDAGIPCSRIVHAPYNQIVQSCLNPELAFGTGVHALVILWRLEDIAPDAVTACLRGDTDQTATVFDAVANILDAAAAVHARGDINGLLAIPPLPNSPVFDSGSLLSGRRLKRIHREVLDRISAHEGIRSMQLFDFDNALIRFGLARAADWRKWYLYRQPYAEGFWLFLAGEIAHAIRANSSARKKCVIVDCDNTLWGGVVGEDGPQGIQLGDDFPGSAYRDFQQQLVSIARSGVFVALCSKNNPPDVWDVFDNHGAMVLRRDHVAIAEISWAAKSAGIASIARQLNIGLDSIVFIDDSSLEIDDVRTHLPEVICVQVPEDPAELPWLLPGGRYFDQTDLTAEDLIRVESFKAEKIRQTLTLTSSPEEYRRTLGLELRIGLADSTHVQRVAQLINKTNQFNLTTTRRTEAEVAALIGDPHYRVFIADLNDRFGAYGIVGVAVVRAEQQRWEFDTFLLSCRALGRGVESAFMSELCRTAGMENVGHVIGLYRPTPKNVIARDFYVNMNFAALGAERFSANVADVSAVADYVTISRL